MPGAYEYRWDDTNEVWVKAPAVVTVVRLIAAGPVVGGAHKLYWITLTSNTANATITLSDDITGLTGIVYSLKCLANDSRHVVLAPPMPFTDGIYLKSVDKVDEVIFGYV